MLRLNPARKSYFEFHPLPVVLRAKKWIFQTFKHGNGRNGSFFDMFLMHNPGRNSYRVISYGCFLNFNRIR